MDYIVDSIKRLPDFVVPYHPECIKLNQNESPFDIPVSIKQKICEKLVEKKWNQYPQKDPVGLIKLLSDYTNFSSQGIVVGNGSIELIQAIYTTLCDINDSIVMISPGYTVFPREASIRNLKYKEIPLKEDYSFDVDAIIEASQNAKVVIFANPNNPTGTAISLSEIERIAKSFNGILVIDEAYYEFYDVTALPLLEKYKNIIIIRTCSKVFSIAGIRIGYIIANPEIALQIDKAKPLFSIGILQKTIGEEILKNREYIKDVAKSVIRERELMFNEIKKLKNIVPIPSKTNFFLLKILNNDASKVFYFLKENKILVRHFNIPGLKNTIRVSIGTPEENKYVLENLRKLDNLQL